METIQTHDCRLALHCEECLNVRGSPSNLLFHSGLWNTFGICVGIMPLFDCRTPLHLFGIRPGPKLLEIFFDVLIRLMLSDLHE